MDNKINLNTSDWVMLGILAIAIVVVAVTVTMRGKDSTLRSLPPESDMGIQPIEPRTTEEKVRPYLYANRAELDQRIRDLESKQTIDIGEKSQKDNATIERNEDKRDDVTDKAIKMIRAYVGQEEIRLKKIIEMANIGIEQISLDQKDLSDALTAVEDENKKRAEKSRQRNIKRFDKAERVSLILKNPTINAMAEKYLGEDLTATYAKYKSEVSTELKLHQESEARLRQNRDRYYKSVEGLNEKVEKANVRARKKNDSVIREAEFNLRLLLKQRKPLEDEQKMLITQLSGMKSPNHERRLKEVQTQIKTLDEKIAPAQLQLNTLRAQAAHMDATETETMVRKGYDVAQAARAEADNDVHKDRAHEISMYQTAARYENQTLDRIRDAMKAIYVVQSSKAADAKKKLDYISRSVANIDFLRADEIEKIRENIVEELSKGLTDEGQEEKK